MVVKGQLTDPLKVYGPKCRRLTIAVDVLQPRNKNAPDDAGAGVRGGKNQPLGKAASRT